MTENKFKIISFSSINQRNLSFTISRDYYQKNILNFGEDLHEVHPLAGQGANLGFLDAEALTNEIKKGLNINAKFSAYKNKIYKGKIESVASRVDAQTRSILARAKINNEESEIIPGSLLEIEIFYNEKNALSVPDTSIMYEGSKKFIYKIIENNMIKKSEIETGIRSKGNLEVLSGLNEGDKIIAEGLTKVRPGMKVKPIIKSQ